jgi:hypothetical protein
MGVDDYYPFGLTFNSYQRKNPVYNEYQFNGKEIQNDPPTPTGQIIADGNAGRKVFGSHSQVNDTITFTPGHKPVGLWTENLSDSTAIIRQIYRK